jgi:glutamate 5-kinase
MTGRFARPHRVVVKVGSASLRADRGLAREVLGGLVEQLAAVARGGSQVVLVSSGAVAAGMDDLGLSRRPVDLPTLQATASVGQGTLMHAYAEAFGGHGVPVGQVLLTPSDVTDRVRYLNARNTFERLLALGGVPVVNENDTVATDELRFGDNDRLAALVASMLGAGLLVLLSDVEGVLASDADGQRRVLERIDDPSEVVRYDHGGSSGVGTGGMVSKVEAVRVARFSGCHAVIAAARRPGVVTEAVTGQAVGTWFPPSPQRPESRKLWIAFAKHPTGVVHVDTGAVEALVRGGKSLLAAGVTGVAGDFAAGDTVDVVGSDGALVARGLVAVDRATLERVRGRQQAEVAAVLGVDDPPELVHRDELVVLDGRVRHA